MDYDSSMVGEGVHLLRGVGGRDCSEQQVDRRPSDLTLQ